MIKINEFPDEFKTGYRQLQLLHRPKDGGLNFPQRKSVKITTNGVSEWNRAVEKLKVILEQNPSHRIYACVNERDMSKGIREFKRLQLDADYDTEELKHGFYQDIDNRFFSCLAQPKAAKDVKFLLDCDAGTNMSVLDEFVSGHMIDGYSYGTKNGMHYITKPFNPKLLDGSGITIHRDGLLLVGWCE